MKELSIEEKAKAYDEAIQKLRGMMPNWERLSYNGKTFLQDLIYIFPELKENEDERIRKAIIDFLWKEKIFLQEVHSSVENNQKYRFVMDAIAWLEKQGETSHQQRVEDAMQEVAEKAKIFTEAMEGKTSEEILAEMRGEQKPNKCEGCNNVKGCVACVNGSERAHIEKCYPAWSEECKEAFSDICENCCGRTVELVKNIMQPKQEWSEEDEDKIVLIEKAIYSLVNDGITFTDATRLCDWLKSLKDRCTWKPSDEQMEILSIYADQNNSHGTVLTSLYHDLKKLKG